MEVNQNIIQLINGKNNELIDIVQNKKALHILRAINHPLRIEILKLIDKHKQITVSNIFTTLKIEQAIASQHLAILRKAGFVKTTRERKFIFYAISYTYIKHFYENINLLLSKD